MGSQQAASDFVVSSVLAVEVENLFLLFLRFRYLFSLLSLLFHFSEQLIASAVPAKRIARGMMMREAITGEELSFVVTGGISSRIVYCVKCSDTEDYHNSDK
jgi:hypothetical protein